MLFEKETALFQKDKIKNDIESLQDEVSNTSSYFWYKNGSGTEAGAHVTEVPQAEFQSNPSGGNLLLRSNLIKIRRALITLAEFAPGSVRFFGGGNVVAEFGTTGGYLYNYRNDDEYSFLRMLATGVECGEYSFNEQTQKFEEIYTARLGRDDSFMYARGDAVLDDGGMVLLYFPSYMIDRTGFKVIHDHGIKPFDTQAGYCVPTYIKDNELQVGYTGTGANVQSYVRIKPPIEDEDILDIYDDYTGVHIAEMTYNNYSPELIFQGDIDTGNITGTKATLGALGNGIFALETHQILASQAIAGGAHVYNEVTFTKAGYYPLCIAGYNAPNAVFVPSRLRLKDMAVGSTTVAYDIYNPKSSSGTSNFNADILWLKVSV